MRARSCTRGRSQAGSAARRIRRRGLLTAGLAVAMLTTHGCSPSAPQKDPIIRLIKADPTAVLLQERLIERTPVFSWAFQRQQDLTPWSWTGFDQQFRLVTRGLRLRSSDSRPTMSRDVNLPAAMVDVIEMTSLGPPRGRPVLLWAPNLHPDPSQRTLMAGKPERDRGRKIHPFWVGSHPGWSGTIRRLILRPTGEANQPIRIEEIAGYRLRIPSGRLRQVAARPWKVELESDRRNALLIPAGISVLSPILRIPSDAHLQFALGLFDLTGGDGRPLFGEQEPPQIRVTFEPSDGEQVVLMDGSMGERSGWQDHRVRLSKLAGKRGRLILETLAQPLALPETGLVAWANPEIVSAASSPRRPNLILVSLDTLRADHLSLNGYWRLTTPSLDAWARTVGVNFPNTVAASNWTLPSHVSMFSGLDAIRHGVDYNMRTPPEQVFLAQLLRRAGYATHAVTGGGYLLPDYGFDRGFDYFRFWKIPGGSRQHNLDIDTGIEMALATIEENVDRPFFLFFHTYEVHAPYRPRQPYYQNFGGELSEQLESIYPARADDAGPAAGVLAQWEPLVRMRPGVPQPELSPEQRVALARDLYDAGVAYADEQIGRLLKQLDELEIADRTLVVITSDHGEALGERGLFDHCCLWDDTLKVPLIVAFPGRLEGGRTITEQVRSIDLLPTILDLLQLEPAEDIDGVSLVPLIEGRRAASPPPAWSYSQHQGISLRAANRLKYIFHNHPWPPASGADSFYDLQEDPAETTALAAVEAVGADTARARALERLNERPGLRIDLVNSESQPITGRLECSSLVKRQQLKCFPTCDTVRWLEPRRLEFALQPEQSFSLLLERVPTGRLTMEGSLDATAGAGGEFSLAAKLAELRRPIGRVVVDGSWVVLPAGASPDSEFGRVFQNDQWKEVPLGATAGATGIWIRWQAEASQARDVERHEELRLQLRALGYIN
jgi:arylsulfatase